MSSELTILHVEDNVLDQRRIRSYLADMGFSNLYQCESIQQAQELFEEIDVDVMIIDIILDGSKVDGISYAKSILTQTDIPILFTSSLSDDQTISRIESIPECEYIVKPVPERQLFVALKKLFLRYLLTSDGTQAISIAKSPYFLVKTNSKSYTRIEKNALLYVEADNGGTIIHHTGGKQFVYIKLHRVIEQLKQTGLIRCHISYAINAGALAQYSDEEIILSSNKAIPISRSYRKQVKEKLQNLIVSNS